MANTGTLTVDIDINAEIFDSIQGYLIEIKTLHRSEVEALQAEIRNLKEQLRKSNSEPLPKKINPLVNYCLNNLD